MKLFKTAPKAHAAATVVRLRPSVDISFTALLYFGATLFIGVGAINSQTNLLFGIFGLMIGVLLVAGYISRFSLRKLVVRRRIPEHLVVGDPASLIYNLANRKRFWPSIAVALGELDGCEAFTRQPYTYALHVAGLKSVDVTVPLIPKRRGIHELDSYQISTSFPFGFVKRAVMLRQKDRIVVFPALAQVDPAILLICQAADNAGVQMRPRTGGSDEFYGVREYRPGENPRHIHWRRSARTGDLVVREMTHVSPPKLLLAVDTYCPGDEPEVVEHVERAIAIAASLASLALERGYPVGLLARAQKWVHIAPSRGKRHRRDILTELARLGRNRIHDSSELLATAIPLAQMGTTTVLISPHASESAGHRPSARTVVLSTHDTRMAGLFRFGEKTDFGHCMPLEQESPDFAEARPLMFDVEEVPDA